MKYKKAETLIESILGMLIFTFIIPVFFYIFLLTTKTDSINKENYHKFCYINALTYVEANYDKFENGEYEIDDLYKSINFDSKLKCNFRFSLYNYDEYILFKYKDYEKKIPKS